MDGPGQPGYYYDLMSDPQGAAEFGLGPGQIMVSIARATYYSVDYGRHESYLSSQKDFPEVHFHTADSADDLFSGDGDSHTRTAISSDRRRVSFSFSGFLRSESYDRIDQNGDVTVRGVIVCPHALPPVPERVPNPNA